MRCHFTKVKIVLFIFLKENNKCLQSCGEIACTLQMGMCYVSVIVEKSSTLPQTVNFRLPYDPACDPGKYSKERKVKSRRDMCVPMFIAAWVTIAKMWKQPEYQPMNG